MTTIPVLALIAAIVATVLAFVFIIPEKKRASLNKIGQFAHDLLNFKFLIIEKILQALYVFFTAYIILLGFFMLFYVQEGYQSYYYSTPSVWYGGYGLLLMILGPIVIRIIYEFLMMSILLVKNVIQINNKTKGENGGSSDVFGVPSKDDYADPTPAAPAAPAAPEAPAANAPRFCSNCGSWLNPDGSCPNCK